MLGGARGVVDGARGTTISGRLQEVVGDLGEVGLQLVAVVPLERLGGEQMQAGAAVGPEPLQQRVAHERVVEGEAVRAAVGHDESAAQRRLEPVEHGGGGLVDHAGQRLQAKLRRR